MVAQGGGDVAEGAAAAGAGGASGAAASGAAGPAMQGPGAGAGAGAAGGGAGAGAGLNGASEFTPGGAFRRSEVVRLITQAARDLGLREAAAMLERESGIALEAPDVARLRESVLAGAWDEAARTVRGIELRVETDRRTMHALLAEQRFMELLEARDTKGALAVLRNELAEVCTSTAHLSKLSSYVMYATAEDVRAKSGWLGRDGGSRAELVRKLQGYLAPSARVPDRRLEQLLQQAQAQQQNACLYHNERLGPLSLYEDHHCDRHAVPRTTRFVFEGHKDEVWVVAFSNNGRYLASGGKDGDVIIWDIPGLVQRRTLRGTHAVSFASWSPDDRFLVTCCHDKKARLWSTRTGTLHATLSAHTETVTAVVWLPDGRHFVTGSLDKSILCWDLNGQCTSTWRGPRVVGLAIDQDGRQLVAVGQDKRIMVYNMSRADPVHVLPETDMISSVDVTRDGKFAIVSVASNQVHLWDLQKGVQTQRFLGHVNNKYVIRSCFGGVDEAFVLSGSEDNHVYLWHRQSGQLLDVLRGHTSLVNAVAWSPTNPSIIASASDDGTVRLWAPDATFPLQPVSNGSAHGDADDADGDGTADRHGDGAPVPAEDGPSRHARRLLQIMSGISDMNAMGGGDDDDDDDNDDDDEEADEEVRDNDDEDEDNNNNNNDDDDEEPDDDVLLHAHDSFYDAVFRALQGSGPPV